MTSPLLTWSRGLHRAASAADSPVESLLENGVLRRVLSEVQRQELRELNRETDPNLMGEALLDFARRLEREENVGAALEVYATLVGGEYIQPLQIRARTRLNAQMGTAPWQDRIEILGRRFVAQATDPAMIFAFGLAGGVANLVRGGTMASLALRAPGLASRGFGARLFSGGAAYLAEVPVFVGAHRSARGLLHPETASGSWGEELAGAALFLGVLKLSGGVAGELMRGRVGSATLRQGVSHVAQLGGIYSAHFFQESLGLRPAQDSAGRAVDTLDTFFQMQVGGRLLHGVLPTPTPRLAAMLEPGLVRGIAGVEAPGFALRARSTSLPRLLPDRVATSERDAPPSPTRVSESAPEIENTARREILQRYDRDVAVGIIQSYEAIAKLLERPLGSVFEAARPWLAMEGDRLSAGIRRLRHAAQYSSADGLKGNYLNWLLRLSMQETLLQGRSEWGSRLLGHLENGASYQALEALLAEQVPAYDLFGRRSHRAGPMRDIPPSRAQERAIRSLPLSAAAQEVLLRFARYQGEIPLEFFDNLGSRLRSADPVARLIEPILLGLRESPVAYLRMVRLFQILEHDASISAKLLELNDGQLRVWGDRERGSAVLATLRSQGDAYLGEGRWVQYLNRLHRESASLRHPLEAMRRREAAEAVLNEIWPEPRELNAEDLTRALEALPDLMSRQSGAMLRAGRVELRILPDAEFGDFFARHNGNQRGELVQAFLLPASEGFAVDQLVMRQVQRVSDPVFRRVLRERLVQIVHEFDHHLHPPLSPRSDLSALREELPAHLRHIHYRALLGHPEELDAMFTESPAGPALYLRDKVEAAYFLRYVHRVGPGAAMASEPGGAADPLARLQGQSDYIRGLLNLGARALDAAVGDSPQPLPPHFLEWIQEADWSLRQYQRDLLSLRGTYLGMESRDRPGFEAEARRFQELDSHLTDWRRVSQQMRAVYEAVLRDPTAHGEEEIRRRTDWIASLGRFDLALTRSEPPVSSDSSRYDLGLDLLRRFQPRFSAEQAELFERAARGPIRDRDIAFDLDKTLGDTLMRYLAEDAFRDRPQNFDVRMDDFVHQYTRLRLPYRGVQAMLLGLWAAGNRVRLYTASENLVGNHEVFFNDFPLIKVAMEIVPPSDPQRLVSREDLHAAPHYMDRIKFREFSARHFDNEAGRNFLAQLTAEQGLRRLPDLTVAKLPFPDFPFDVLVDDLYYFAGDLMTVGLGRRMVLAEGDVPRMLGGLEAYFSRPLPEASPLWLHWLSENSLTY